MFKRPAIYAIDPRMNTPSIIIKPFNPDDEMRKLYLSSSKAASYFSFSPYPFEYKKRLYPPVANQGHVVEELLINKYFPGQKNHNTYFYNPLGLCATPDVITDEGDLIEIKSVQKRSIEALSNDFLKFFDENKQMNLDKVINNRRRIGIMSNLIQCLVALYVLNEASVEQKDYYYLIYSVVLTGEERTYRLQITNMQKFRGWIKILSGLYDTTEGKVPYNKKNMDEGIPLAVKNFLQVDYAEDFLRK